MNPDETLIEALQRKVRELSDNLESLTYTFGKKTGLSSNSIISPRIQSADFETGVSGWGIESNGNAEFNDGTFRGTFNIGGSQITISTVADIQTSLNTVSADGGGTVFLEAGTYLLTADISIPDGVTLQGVSRDGVIIDCNTSYKVQITGSNVYSTGTVTINNGDTTVVGSSTVWTAAMIGRYIWLDGEWYEITARADNTHITIGAYAGVNLAGATYALATVNFNPTMRRLTITNATGSGVVVSYASEPNIDDIVVYGCGTGLDLDYVLFPRIFVASTANGVNLDMNYVSGFKIDFCELSDSTTGAGVVFTNCQNATFIDSEMSRNTGNGMSLTSCKGITFFSMTVDENGAKGIEMVSGNSNLQFLAVGADSNTSDGYKLTATDDNIIITDSTVSNNGGYGVNIAASTCDNAIISGNSFVTNTSGAINNSGTGTVIRGNVGYSDNSSTYIAADAPVLATAGTDEKPNSTTYTKMKEIVIGQSSGTVRVVFQLRTENGAETAYGRIYVNGVAAGTEQSTTNTVFQTYTEDIAVGVGDLLQLYSKDGTNPNNAHVGNMTVAAALGESFTVNDA